MTIYGIRFRSLLTLIALLGASHHSICYCGEAAVAQGCSPHHWSPRSSLHSAQCLSTRFIR